MGSERQRQRRSQDSEKETAARAETGAAETAVDKEVNIPSSEEDSCSVIMMSIMSCTLNVLRFLFLGSAALVSAVRDVLSEA